MPLKLQFKLALSTIEFYKTQKFKEIIEYLLIKKQTKNFSNIT